MKAHVRLRSSQFGSQSNQTFTNTLRAAKDKHKNFQYNKLRIKKHEVNEALEFLDNQYLRSQKN